VRATGGLADTVQEYDPTTGEGTGFTFRSYHSGDFLDTVREALIVYRDTERWKRLMVRGMRADFSWERAASEYVNLYDKALGRGKRR